MSGYKYSKSQLKWLEALESGEFTQTKGKLCDAKGFCCLGVACVTAGMKPKNDGGGYFVFTDAREGKVAPKSVMKNLKLRSPQGMFYQNLLIGKKTYPGLTDANDDGRTFKQIAKAIRSNPTAVFKE